MAKMDLTPVNYEAKEALLDHLVQHRNPQKRLLVILGSSRLLYLDGKKLRDFYPDWQIYNFSSAVTTPAYFDYQLDRLLKKGIVPDLIFLESDPNQFNANGIFKSSNLTYSFSFRYVLENLRLFGKEHVFYFLGKRIFAVGTYRPYLNQMWRNAQSENFEAFVKMREDTFQHILKEQGNGLSPVENYFEKDWNSLEMTSQRTLDWLFANYKWSEMQMDFFRQLLSRAEKNRIRLEVVWPESSPPFQRRIGREASVLVWKTHVEKELQNRGKRLVDLANLPSYECNAFADGGHVSQECYDSLFRSILTEEFRL